MPTITVISPTTVGEWDYYEDEPAERLSRPMRVARKQAAKLGLTLDESTATLERRDFGRGGEWFDTVLRVEAH